MGFDWRCLPEKTVTSGNCREEVVVRNACSVTGEAVTVVVVLTGVDAVVVSVGASGALSCRCPTAALAFWSSLSLAASILLRAYSISTGRSTFLVNRNLSALVGVARAAGWIRVG